jgi:regulator of replication initiation timing
MTNRRAAGSRNHPVKSDLAGALSDGISEIEELKTEMEEWKDSLESNNMEHLPKYDEVQEAYDALETGLDALQGIEVPEFLEEIDASYTQDTRRKAQSRSYRLGNALNAIDAAKCAAESWLDENPELEVEDDPEGELQAVADERAKQREAAEEFFNEVDSAYSELDCVSFPGMY